VDKLKKGGDFLYKESFDNLVSTRKVLATRKKEDRAMKCMTHKEMENRQVGSEEPRTEMASKES
jgi:hypothetical protein